MNEQSDWTDVHGIAAHLNVDTRTIQRWTAKRLIPYFKIGRTLRFKISAVNQHLAEKALVKP